MERCTKSRFCLWLRRGRMRGPCNAVRSTEEKMLAGEQPTRAGAQLAPETVRK